MRLIWLAVVLALSLALAPAAAEAEPSGKIYRIGVLCPTQCVPTNPVFSPFRQGLEDYGWIEGQTLITEYRHALGKVEDLPKLAAELVSAKVDALIAPSPAAALALKNATHTIPIIFVGIGDPIQGGFVASLARPGGNMTGNTWLTGPELDGKRLELLHDAVPSASRIAVLSVPTNEPYNSRALGELELTAKALKVQLRRLDIPEAEDLELAFSTLAKERTVALLVLVSPLTVARNTRIGELSLAHRIATMAVSGNLVTNGYLLGYGPSFAELYRRGGYYIDKVLRGAKPADLPVEQPTKFELTINLKTAKALGVTIPQTLLLRADQVLE